MPTVYGYLGPCTQFSDTYQFTVYALDLAMLPGVTAVTTLSDEITVVDAHELGFAALLGTSSPVTARIGKIDDSGSGL